MWVLVTAAVSGKFHPASGEFHNATRQQQYEKALPLLRYAVDQANLDSTMIIVENKGPRTTYLDTIAQQIQAKLLYTSNENQVHTTNKGVREYADLHDALEFAAQIEPLSADDWVVKVTGRYMIFSPSPLLAALSNPNLDVIARFGSWAFKGPPRERAMNDLVTGFFAMRVHVWKAFFTANPRGVDPPGAQPDDPIAWATGRFIQSHVPPERVLALDELNALISPGTDDYFVI